MVYKKVKNVFTLVVRLHAFPEIPEMLETHVRKKFIIQHYRETKISQIIAFWSNREIKMQRNLKTVQKTAKLNCHENCFKVTLYQIYGKLSAVFISQILFCA